MFIYKLDTLPECFSTRKLLIESVIFSYRYMPGEIIREDDELYYLDRDIKKLIGGMTRVKVYESLTYI